MKLLDNKNVLITGGTRGIGKGIAITLAKQGANIAFTGRAENQGTIDLAAELSSYGVKAKFFASDVASFNQAQELVAEIVGEFGGVDVLINNAGITKDGLLMRMSEQDWDDVISTNLKSVFNYTKAASSFMMKKRTGSIINMSSIVGLTGNAGQANYSASKAGILGFTKSVAKELGARNIRCNAIAPGFILTDMTSELTDEIKDLWKNQIPLKRAGTTEDVADLCLFLASDLSRYITGQVITCDGGLSL